MEGQPSRKIAAVSKQRWWADPHGSRVAVPLREGRETPLVLRKARALQTAGAEIPPLNVGTCTVFFEPLIVRAARRGKLPPCCVAKKPVRGSDQGSFSAQVSRSTPLFLKISTADLSLKIRQSCCHLLCPRSLERTPLSSDKVKRSSVVSAKENMKPLFGAPKIAKVIHPHCVIWSP